MKKQHKAAISFALALIFALVSLPASALPRFEAKAEITPAWTVPEGYNAHDYTKCVTFLEQTDENGVKNGDKISENYDPNDPETWGLRAEIEDFCFHWTTVNGEQRVREINVELWNLCGRLDVSGCTALKDLYCHHNNLTELDVTDCTALERLDCSYNNLTELDVSGCTALKNLCCDENNLTELDVSGCTALEYLYCYRSGLTELDVSGCTALEYLFCRYNALTELNVTQNPALVSLCCSGNNLTELDVTECTALVHLDCNFNRLAELDIMQNTALNYLDCSFNNLTELDVTQNTALEKLLCHDNSLTELDVQQNSALEELSCYSNNLIELNLSNNQVLAYDHIRAEGNGFIGCYYYDYDFNLMYVGYRCLYAHPVYGASFDGFYDESGALISEGEWSDSCEAYIYEFEGYPTGTIIARFSGGFTAGDIDGDGTVSMNDALTTMRISMGAMDGSGLNTDAADMDGNGSITIVDAIIILRTAMGLA